MQSLQRHFIFYSGAIGLIAWGVPAVFLFPQELLAIFSCCLAGYALTRITLVKKATFKERKSVFNFPDLIFFFSILFLIVDISVGRQAYLNNLFFGSESISQYVSAADDLRGKGRGFFDLLGTIFIFAPFFLFDFGKTSTGTRKYLFIGLAFILFMNEVQASRGYLLMAILSFFLAGRYFSIRRVFLAVCVAVVFFMIGSWYRGDFEVVSYSNPLIDGLAWPYVNLGLYFGAECGSASLLEFLQQIGQKILPSFIVDKEVLSLNLVVSECIYNSSIMEIGSVSVFTYLAELHYYKPGWIVAITAGSLLCLANSYLDSYFSRHRTYSAQIFMGLFVILLLRSRILDVFSFFLALLLFIVITKLLGRRFFGGLVPRKYQDLS